MSGKTPFIVDLKPSCNHLMEDLYKACCPDSCTSLLKFSKFSFFQDFDFFVV